MNEEKSFLKSIDCNFPFNDDVQWKLLVDKALRISETTAFAVLHEICRSRQSSKSKKLRIIDYWDSRYSHPMKPFIVDVAKTIVNGMDYPVDDVLKYIKMLHEYPKLFYALSILYFSCDDIDGVVEDEYENIIKIWKEKGES